MKILKWTWMTAVCAAICCALNLIPVVATAEEISDESFVTRNVDTTGILSGGGCNECDECDDCSTKLLGFIAPTDTCYVDFISPMTNPVYFEDPRTVTELRFIFINHVIPNRAPLVGGDLQAIAMQIRAALTERLSIIATKDGFVFTGSDPAVIDDGWLNINAGLKYQLWADACSQQIISAGLTYEMPTGSPQTLQGKGNPAIMGSGSGIFHMFLTGGTAIGESGHWISSAGMILPADSQAQSQLVYWSNHWDKRIGNTGFYALTELNWYHWMRSGNGPLNGIEGGDLFNLGATGVAGNDIVTGAIGGKYKPTDLSEIGLCWEVPLTDRRDVLDNRLTADFIVRY